MKKIISFTILVFISICCLGQTKYSFIIPKFESAAKKHNADTKFMFIVDYSIPSNKNRFFLYDVVKNKIIYSCWCAHGCGGGSTAEKPVFSNQPGSNCSSLGWYLIDKSVGQSAHYKYNYHTVDGLSSSNSNARTRQILIHHWWQVDDDYNNRINVPMNCDYRSAGCFTTTKTAFNYISNFIKSRNKRLLLYAIY